MIPDVLTGYDPHVLRDYALIADGERGALCGPHGDLAWLCAPRWHDDAVFARLIGGAGGYAVTPIETHVWGGYYETGSLIWRNRWVTTSTVIECRDALAMPADPHRVVVLRRIEAPEALAQVRVLLDVRAGFGSAAMTDLHLDADGRWTARSGDLTIRWSGAPEASRTATGDLMLDLALSPNQTRDLVLEISDAALPAPVDPDLAWARTEREWADAVPSFSTGAAPTDAQQSYAVLRALTSSGGGMVAAATMSLPERAEQGRNYDYRYVWIRDQCYAGIAVAADGPDPLLIAATRFVAGALLAEGPDLKPAYTIDGGRVPDESSLALVGYPGGTDVRGNWVNSQFQLDTPGEALQLFTTAARCDALDRDVIAAAGVAVDVIEARWREPDAGIWEIDDQWWTHSRLACVAGLRRAATVRAFGDPRRATALADEILEETSRHCLAADGSWQRSPDLPGVDAALLLPPIRGALPARDHRTTATLRQVRERLLVDGYVYRYDIDDRPLGAAEGAFLLCGFTLALAEWQQGHRTEAIRVFERNRAACGSPGLLAEEFDVTQRQLRGNLPQAFVHALLLEASTVIGGAGPDPSAVSGPPDP